MESVQELPPVQLAGDELQHYIDTHNEKRYLLIDVRQPTEYQAGHIPGARFRPRPDLEARLFELPANRDLIF